jgi:uncharacterized membrane protein
MTAATEHIRRYGGSAPERPREADRYREYQTYNRRVTDQRSGISEDTAQRRARGLGWFSIGLGLAQIGAPRSVARLIGVRDDDETRNTMFAIGLREITSGLGILSSSQPTGWVWSRVGGDLMDLALLGRSINDCNDKNRVTAATAAVAGVTILDFITGQQLRREGNGAQTRINGAASVQQRQSTAGGVHVVETITLRRPRNEVYGFWHNFENLPRFMAHLESVQVLDGMRSHWKAKAPAGTTVEWDAEMVEDRPNELIAWRSLEGSTVPNSGSVQFKDAPGNRGTEVRVEVRYQPPGGKIGALFAKLFGEEPQQQVKGDLRRFKQVMETGEIVHSDASIHEGLHPAQPPRSLNDVELIGSAAKPQGA